MCGEVEQSERAKEKIQEDVNKLKQQIALRKRKTAEEESSTYLFCKLVNSVNLNNVIQFQMCAGLKFSGFSHIYIICGSLPHINFQFFGAVHHLCTCSLTLTLTHTQTHNVFPIDRLGQAAHLY